VLANLSPHVSIVSRNDRRRVMRTLLVSQFISLDNVIQAPGSAEEDTDGGFTQGGWVAPYFCPEMGAQFGVLFQGADALLLGRRTYVGHAQAFEPDAANDPFNGMKKYVVSKTLEKSLWRDTTILRGDVLDEVKKLKATPGKTIVSDGSSQLMHALLAADLVDELHLFILPIVLGNGKRLFPLGASQRFTLTESKTYPTGVVGVRYTRQTSK
jgi:dihydrofolate reductase